MQQGKTSSKEMEINHWTEVINGIMPIVSKMREKEYILIKRRKDDYSIMVFYSSER